ncbi:hypothetical protein UBN67_07510 [Helicobacter pylori]
MLKKGKDPKKVLKHTTTKTLENWAYISDPHSCGWGAHWGLCGHNDE